MSASNDKTPDLNTIESEQNTIVIKYPPFEKAISDYPGYCSDLSPQLFRAVVSLHDSAPEGVSKDSVRGLAREARWHLENTDMSKNATRTYLRATNMLDGARQNLELYERSA